MEIRDTVNSENAGRPQSPDQGPGARVVKDLFEPERQWTERTEEEQVEATAALYERAARQWMPAAPEAPDPEDAEELEARSQQLKLQQKCQDIAALMMVEELEEELDGEDTK